MVFCIMSQMVPQWIIEKKRDGGELTSSEIKAFIDGYTLGDIPDYQMSALAMAIFFKGMTFDEVTYLTDSMLHSGDLVDTASLLNPSADKHSTGGIGDKISLLLAPLAACCDIDVPMISGRGLGITGGTLDKLESIPGYRTDLSEAEFIEVLNSCGCSITGQTGRLAPADKKLYALRDVTATVPSIPLIAASIMSKKLAEGADALVLDIKCGSGAFMKRIEDARELGQTLVEIGTRMGKRMIALITDMNAPIGATVGNALEVQETLDGLAGNGSPELMSITMALTSEMLMLSGRATHMRQATHELQGLIESGTAYSRFHEMVTLHGGVADIADGLPSAHIQEPLLAQSDGVVHAVDADGVGRACMVLGAGRSRVDADVDPAVGIADIAPIGTECKKGDVLATLHANSELQYQEALKFMSKAFTLGTHSPTERKLILERITPGDCHAEL